MSEVELKPCPFCGGKAKLSSRRSDAGHGQRMTIKFVKCSRCEAQSAGWSEDFGEADRIHHWNKREHECISRASGWIGVDESLPDDGEDVLAFCGSTIYHVFQYRDGEGFFSYILGGYRNGWVTHWMPLPSPPEE